MQHTSKAHKFFAISMLFIGVSMFGFVIAIMEEWTPFPTANAANASEPAHMAVIPVDEPVNIETDGKLAMTPVTTVPEIVIIAEPTPKPGAARMMPGPSEASQLVNPGRRSPRLASPTGIASDAALSYNPLNKNHAVQKPHLEMNVSAFSQPHRRQD